MGFVTDWNQADLALLAVMLLGMLLGMRRGLSGELAGAFSVLFAVWLAWASYPALGREIEEVTRLSERASLAAAFILAVLGGLLFMRMTRFVLRHIMECTFKPPLERAGGALSGALRLGLLGAAVVFLCGFSPHDGMRRFFAEHSLAGRFLHARFPPFYSSLTERYPQLPDWPAGQEHGDQEEQTYHPAPSPDPER